MKEESSLDRRSFLKGTLAAGAVAASAGLIAGCSPSNQSGSSSSDASGSDTNWDAEYDFVIVGSGGAAWGALSALDLGAESVLIVEKGDLFGGTTSLSEGITWVPVNYLMEKEGIEDNREDAIKYVTNIAQGQVTDELKEAYIDEAPKFIEWTREAWGFEWERFYDWINQDYYQVDGFRPRGRSINVDPVASAKNILGETWEKPEKPSNYQTFKIIRALCDSNGVEIMMPAEGKKLITDESGVIGLLIVDSQSKEVRVKAKKGVLLGTGGFDFNDEMRTRFLHTPLFASRHVETNTGDGQRMGQEIGAALANMASVYGQCCLLPQGDQVGMQRTPEYTVTDSYQFRGKPGAVVVNRYGKRIGNESTIYANFQRCMEGWDPATFSLLNVPAFWICDSEFVEHYKVPGGEEIGDIPEWITKADSLEELAEAFGIDKEGLLEEIERFNEHAAEGKDPVWHRGEFSHDQRSVADTTRDDLSNQCLAPVKTPPFYAARYYSASLGTAGGLAINGKAQVLDVNGEVISGLYACGCAACSPYGAGYAGGGAPVGASSVMAWVAARTAFEGN